jgi:hypothetical protein
MSGGEQASMGQPGFITYCAAGASAWLPKKSSLSTFNTFHLVDRMLSIAVFQHLGVRRRLARLLPQ